MSMCKLHSEFYRQQAKLDALLTRRCHTITEGKNGEGATYIKTARGWLHIAHGVRNTAEGLRYVIYLFVTDLKEPWKVIAEPAGFLIAPRGWERVSDVSNVVFTNGAIADDDGKVYIYYAASDTRLHVASTTIEQLMDYTFNTPSDPLRSADCVKQRQRHQGPPAQVMEGGNQPDDKCEMRQAQGDGHQVPERVMEQAVSGASHEECPGKVDSVQTDFGHLL